MGEVPGAPASSPLVPAGRRRRYAWAAAALLAVVLAGVGLALYRGPAPAAAPPDVSLDGADPAVRRAVEQAQDAVRREPRSGAAWGRLGQVLFANGFTADSESSFVEAARLDPREPRWPYFAGVVRAIDDPEGALPLLDQAADRFGDGPTVARLRLAELLERLGRADAAAEQYRRVLAVDAGQGRAALGLARVRFDQEQWAESAEWATRAAHDPLAAEGAYLLLARLYQRDGKRAEADAAVRKARNAAHVQAPLDPVYEELEAFRVGRVANLRYANELLKQEHWAQAAAVMRRTVEDYPKAADCWLVLARALIKGGDWRGAEQAVRETIRLDRTLVDGHFYLGAALFEQGQYAAAAAAFRHAAALKPDYDRAHYNLGQSLLRLGDRAGAVAAFRDGVRCKPNFAGGRVKLAELLAEDGLADEAAEQLHQALRLEPGNERARTLLRELEAKQHAPAKP